MPVPRGKARPDRCMLQEGQQSCRALQLQLPPAFWQVPYLLV